MSARPYKPRPSDIHGLGVIATRLIRVGEVVRVNLGAEFRGFNHSCEANLSGLVFAASPKNNYRFALCDIAAGSEVTVDYRVWGHKFEFICHCPKCRKENT